MYGGLICFIISNHYEEIPVPADHKSGDSIVEDLAIPLESTALTLIHPQP